MCSLGVAGQANVRMPRIARATFVLLFNAPALKHHLEVICIGMMTVIMLTHTFVRAETLSARTAPSGTKWASDSYFLINAMKHGDVNGLCRDAHQDGEGGHLQCMFLSRAVCLGALPVLELTSCCQTSYFPHQVQTCCHLLANTAHHLYLLYFRFKPMWNLEHS